MSVGADLFRHANKDRMVAAEVADRAESAQGQLDQQIRAEVSVYINRLLALAKASGVAAFEITDGPVTVSNFVEKLIEAEHFLDRLYAENISELDNASGLGSIPLDSTWKAKVSSYVSHIRETVARAQMPEAIRERILKALAQLQLEIDRNRTRPQAWAEVWLPITEAIGQGAKNLDPALRLLEKGAGAISRLLTAISGGDLPPRLPSPDSLGLDNGTPEA